MSAAFADRITGSAHFLLLRFEQEDEAKPKGPELITAALAFQKVYVAARGWNLDAKPRWPAAMATVTMASGKLARKFCIGHSAFREDVYLVGKCSRWSPGSRHRCPVSKTATPLRTPQPRSSIWRFLRSIPIGRRSRAEARGSDLLEGANTCHLHLRLESQYANELTWHVIYGAAREGAKLAVDINASTGELAHGTVPSAHGESEFKKTGIALTLFGVVALFDVGVDLGKEVMQCLRRSDGSASATCAPVCSNLF